MLKETYRYIVVICMLSSMYNINTAYGSPNKVCTPLTKLRGPHRQGACGDTLQFLLDLACNDFGGFNSRGKRETAKVNEEKQLDDVTMSRADANTYLINKKTNYHDTGIVCECCYHQCSLFEMRTYCLLPSRIGKRDESLFKRTLDTKGETESDDMV